MIRGIPSLGGSRPDVARVDDGVTELAQRSFRLALLEALRRAPAGTSPAAAPSPPAAGPPPLPALADEFVPLRASGTRASSPPGDGDEERLIDAAAARAAVDARFLQALRRAENGGPGREFGVLSVPAPTYEDQARVAAETIRKNVERFERTGGVAIDAGGRYTEAFIRFFSSRYAPVGAANDPTGLNRHHAQNLIRLYEKLAPRSEG